MEDSFFLGFLIFGLHTFYKIVQVASIEGSPYINGHIGEDAFFKWNTTDQRKILSVSWGIKKGNIADPQFINVNVYDNKVNKNEDLEEAFRNRTEFIGNLNKGRAWFKLKNLTVTDTNYYIASISDTVTGVWPYYAHLEVFEKTRETSTADYEQTTANNTKITEAVNMTTTIPNNTTSDQTMITTNYVVAIIVPLVCVVFYRCSL